MKRLFLIILGLCLPMLAFAANTHIFDLFNPPAIANGTDLSVDYLGDIFGIVDGVLHGSGSQIMGQMFMVFNAGALILGGIIVIYTTLISLLNTANEGELMGKKWSEIWIPLRTVLGIGLLIPKATGYCAIQIFMMWVIVQGVGLADTVWNQAINYLAAGGVIVQQALVPQSNVTKTAEPMLVQSVCLAGLQSTLNSAYIKASQNKLNPPPIPSFIGSITPLKPTETNGVCPNDTCTAPLPDFPKSGSPLSGDASQGFDWSTLNGMCGSVSWTQIGSSSSSAAKDQTLIKAYGKIAQIAVQQLYLDMSGPAQSVVELTVYPPSGLGPDVGTYLNPRMFLDAGQDYQGIMYPAQHFWKNRSEQATIAKWVKSASANGWIDAGSYYQSMTTADNSIAAALYTAPTVTAPTSSDLNSSLIPASLAPYVDITTLSNFLTGTASSLNVFINNAPTSDNNYGGHTGNTHSRGALKGGGILMDILSPLSSPLVSLFEGFIGLTHSQEMNYNPVVMIAQLGTGLMGLVVDVWIVGAVTLAIATGALASFPCFGYANIMNVVTEWMVPFLWAICGMLFAEGMVMTYYVPMIPYILFLFGAVGWLIATLEAMVAAPIVALGITHPEGQEVMGKADPAVLMLVNVFLRPSMMIIGFIAGIILSYVSVWLLNLGFFHAYDQAFEHASLLTIIFAIPAMLIVYVGIVIGLLNYVFQLVNVVPDKVLRWIGGQGEGIAGEAGKMLGEVKQGVSQAGQSMGTGGQKVAEGAGGRSDKETKQESTVENDKNDGAKADGQKKGENDLNVTDNAKKAE